MLHLWLVTQLLGGQRVLLACDFVRPVWTTATGPVPTGTTLAHFGARLGPRTSLARQIPSLGSSRLYVTGQNLVTTPATGTPTLTTTIARSAVSGVHKKLRYQQDRQFRLVFSDGSSAAFVTAGSRTIPALQATLGRR